MTTNLLATCMLLFVTAACSGAQSGANRAKTTTVSLVMVDCSDCGDKILSDLRSRPGVYAASYDRRRAEIVVTASPSFDVYTIVKELAADAGFDALLGAGQGSYEPARVFPPGSDVVFPSAGGTDLANLGALAVPGKVTIVDFAATWCGPCRVLEKHVAKLLEKDKGIAYRRLDVGDWGSPLAQHYLKHVPHLPYVIVYGRGGETVDSVIGADLEKLDAAIAKGEAK